MRGKVEQLIVVLALVLLVACGSSGGAKSPTKPAATLSSWSRRGTGDDVLDVSSLTDKAYTKAVIRHDGNDNFVVWACVGAEKIELLVNAIGDYSGTVLWEPRADTLTITADGPWEIVVQ